MAPLHVQPELITRSQRGDAQAFDRLVSLTFQNVYNTAYRMVNNANDASDATQEAFIRAFKSIKSYRRDASFSTWLYRIVVNVCLDIIRRKRRDPASASDLESDTDLPTGIGSPDRPPMPEQMAETRERQAVVHAAIGKLSEEHRTVLVLFDIQGLTYDEISETLGIPVGTFKSRLNRALMALKTLLEPHMELLS